MCSYKFDFAVRNKRVDRSKNIFKYYALYSAIRDFWEGSNLLGEKPSTQRVILKKVTRLLEDEEMWVKHIERVSSVLEGKIFDQGLETREQVRDYIRTDAALVAFAKESYES